MKMLRNILVLFLIFILSVYSSFYFEESFRKITRYLYVAFSNEHISFSPPRKDFHFASDEFVLGFGLFTTFSCFLLYRLEAKRIINIALILVLFASSVLIFCYFGSLAKLATCTSCQNGNLQLHYREISYDRIFISSLIFAIVPLIIKEVKELVTKK